MSLIRIIKTVGRVCKGISMDLIENHHYYDVINVNNSLNFTLQPCGIPQTLQKYVLQDYWALCAHLKLFYKSDLIQKYKLCT